MLKGKDEESRNVLTRIHGEELAEAEIEEIRESISEKGGLSIKEIFKLKKSISADKICT